MTFIQPNKNSSFLNGILVLFGIALAVGTLGMVMLYNATVNLSHGIATAKAELDAVGAATTDFNNKVVATLAGGGLNGFSAAHGMIIESKPQYFSVSQAATNQKWPIASHF